MHLSRIQLQQFRSYTDKTFSFGPNVTAIIGVNGSGKTNILEAIYTVCMGKSFRDSDEELLQYETDWWKAVATIDDTVRELRYQPSQKGKQLYIDEALKGRFTYRQQVPVVLFEPDDLYMLHGSPGARRTYIDELIQKLYPSSRVIFRRYERVIAQRNNLLKQRQPLQQLKDNLFVWDVGLADAGSKIIQLRNDVIEAINARSQATYSALAGTAQAFSLTYVHPQSQTAESQIISALAHHLDDDIRRGFTGIGPHRHDIEFMLRDKLAKHTASRGEIRTIMLSLKQIELQLIHDAVGIEPLLLLDDVFSELDKKRQQAVLEYMTSQTIMTTTDLPDGFNPSYPPIKL